MVFGFINLVERDEFLCLLQFYKNFCSNLEDIIWKPPNESTKAKITNSMSKKRWFLCRQLEFDAQVIKRKLGKKKKKT